MFSLVVVLAVLVVSGCVSVPERAAPPKSMPSKVVLTSREFDAVAGKWFSDAGYERLRAMDGDGHKALANAFIGPALDTERFFAAVRKRDREQVSAWATDDPKAVYAGTATAYPMTLITRTRINVGKRELDGWYVMRKAHTGEPWKMALACSAKDYEGPTALPPGPTAMTTPQQRRRVTAAATDVLEHLETGEEGALTGTSVLGKMREQVAWETHMATTSIKADYYEDGRNQVGPTGSVTAFRTRDGVLAAVQLRLTVDVRANPGYVIWQDGTWGKVLGTGTRTTELGFSATAHVIIHVPDKGSPRVGCAQAWPTLPSVGSDA